MASDIEYYRTRAIEERDRAAAASEPSIANIHRDLAIKYEGLAREAESQPTLQSGWSGDSDAQPA